MTIPDQLAQTIAHVKPTTAFALFNVDIENALEPLHPGHRIAALLNDRASALAENIIEQMRVDEWPQSAFRDKNQFPANNPTSSG